MLSGSAPLAAVATALAVGLARGPALPSVSGPRRRPPWVLGVAAVVVVAAVLPPRVTSLVLIAAGASIAGLALGRQRAAAVRASAVADGVLESCEALAADLGAGQGPGTALHEASRVWPGLARVADVFDLGGDVPGALRSAAAAPGADGLRLLAAAWTVSERTGAGLAGGARSAAERVRRRHDLHRVVAGELASARATARLMAGLPLLVLLMGSGAGGDPWRFLLFTSAGLGCLALGAACAGAGLWWLEVIARSVDR